MRVGIAGLGGQAELLASAISRVDGASLVAVASSTPARASEFALRFGAEATTGYDELVERDDLDLVIVSTANNRHAAIAGAALRAGRNVYCEKPLALSLAEAEALIDASALAGRHLFTGFHLRQLPVVAALRAAVGRGDLGRPLDLRFSRASQFRPQDVRAWRHDLTAAGGGVLCDVAPHLIDLVHHITGDSVVAVSAVAHPDRSTGRPDDRINLLLTLESGAVAGVTATRGVAGAESELHVHGSGGSACTGPIRFTDSHELTVTREDEEFTEVFDVGDPLAQSIAAVKSALSGGDDAVASGEDGARAAAVFDAAVISLTEYRQVKVDRRAGPRLYT